MMSYQQTVTARKNELRYRTNRKGGQVGMMLSYFQVTPKLLEVLLIVGSNSENGLSSHQLTWNVF